MFFVFVFPHISFGEYVSAENVTAQSVFLCKTSNNIINTPEYVLDQIHTSLDNNYLVKDFLCRPPLSNLGTNYVSITIQGVSITPNQHIYMLTVKQFQIISIVFLNYISIVFLNDIYNKLILILKEFYIVSM